jgi:hypothetical protein
MFLQFEHLSLLQAVRSDAMIHADDDSGLTNTTAPPSGTKSAKGSFGSHAIEIAKSFNGYFFSLTVT